MPAQYTLPPDTRSVGSGNPPSDVNAHTDALAAMGATFNVLNAAYAGGADPTGTSDSSAAINAAMAALPSSTGGTVLIPPGLYKITAPLVPTISNTRLLGAGLNATIIQAATGSTINGYQFDATTQLYNLIFCCIEGITFDGNGNASGYGCHINYNLTHTFWDFYLRDVWFKNWGNDGFWSTGGHGYVLDHVLAELCTGNGINFTGGFLDSPPRIVNGTIKLNGGAGVLVNTIDAYVGHNEISANTGGGLVLSASGCKAVGNQIRTNTGNGAHVTGGSEGITLTGNTISSSGQHGLLLDDANCTIDGNFFNANSISSAGSFDDINITRGTFNASGNFITGNIIDCASQSRYGINLAHSGDTSCVLTANRIVGAVTAPTATIPTDTIIVASGNFTIGPAFLTPPSIYAPVTQTSKTVSTTTMAAFFSTSINTGAFTAPTSGNVIVGLRCMMGSGSGTFVGLGLAAHGTVTPLVCNSVVFQFWTTDIVAIAADFYVSGLTPGTSYNFDLLGCASTGSCTISAFATTSTTPTLTALGVGSPAVMTVLGV